MSLKKELFPPPESLGEAEFIASQRIVPELLESAYYQGYFPWPDESVDFIPWAHPLERGIIEVEAFHIPHMVERMIRQLKFEIRIDTAFDEVIEACSLRRNGEASWITPEVIKCYKDFHRAGWAHSVEAWNREQGTLAGGLYGVSVGGVFAGESMFFRESGASKYALAALGMILKKCRVAILDTQMVTPTTGLFGSHYVPRQEYVELLKKHRSAPLDSETLRRAAGAIFGHGCSMIFQK